MKTPVLFIIFNRPETTKAVFQKIKQYKPSQLFIAADGPRINKPEESKLCEQARSIVKEIDWECDIKTLFRDKNLGCGVAVSSAITWFFENVEMGIILEDDCLPNKSFFGFCNDLLIKYKEDKNIFMISGDNFLPEEKSSNEDYYLTRMPHIWGWATWKRAWDKYDFNMKEYPTFLKDKMIGKIWKSHKTQRYFLERIGEVYNKRIDTWDYQWVYTIWTNEGFAIAPKYNLISNIGFSQNGTHTLDENDKCANLEAREISLPLAHPAPLKYNSIYDEWENKYMINTNHITLKEVLRKFGMLNIAKNIYLSFKKIK